MELFTILTCGFLLLSREVGYLFAGEEYYDGIGILPVIAISSYFAFMYSFPVNFEFFHKKTSIVAIGTTGCALLNIGLNWLMIPKWGMYGAAIATALSYFALFAAHYIIVHCLKGLKFHMKLAAFLPGLLAVGACIAVFYLLADFWYIRWGAGALLGVYELYRIIKRKSIF